MYTHFIAWLGALHSMSGTPRLIYGAGGCFLLGACLALVWMSHGRHSADLSKHTWNRLFGGFALGVFFVSGMELVDVGVDDVYPYALLSGFAFALVANIIVRGYRNRSKTAK